MNIDENSLRSMLFDLIRIPSVNPSLLADSQAGSTQVVGEGEIARYVAEALTSFGLEVQQFEPQPGRVTVLGVLKGAGGGRSLMLNAHSDTVGVGGMKDAFVPSLQVGKVYGRGAQRYERQPGGDAGRGQSAGSRAKVGRRRTSGCGSRRGIQQPGDHGFD